MFNAIWYRWALFRAFWTLKRKEHAKATLAERERRNLIHYKLGQALFQKHEFQRLMAEVKALSKLREEEQEAFSDLKRALEDL